MRLFLLPVCLVVAAAACADLKSADPPRETADPTEPAPEPTANSAAPPTVVATPPSGSPIGIDGNASTGDSGSITTPNSDSGALPQASVDDICEPYCDWRDRCPGTEVSTHADCVAHCHGEWAARVPHLQSRYVTYVKGCFPLLTCEKTDDTCFSNYAVVDPDPVNIPEVKQCRALVTSCGDSLGAPSDSTCYVLSIFDQATRTAAAQCFALECSVMRKCMKNTWGGE